MGLKQEREIITNLEGVYGKRVDRKLYNLRLEYPSYPITKIAEVFKERPTCMNSYFGRESNIQGLAWMISQDQANDWQILSAGCSAGQEPYELASYLVKANISNFRVDAFDVSRKNIEQANKGIFSHDLQNGRQSEERFFSEMGKAGLLKAGSKYTTQYSEFINYTANKEVKERINFYVNDIIDRPFSKHGQLYDVIICNNVLYHYPASTRDVIIINLLENIKDGGILVLENIERNGLSDNRNLEALRENLLKPYFAWRETFGEFGLRQEKIENDSFITPLNIYRYQGNRRISHV